MSAPPSGWPPGYAPNQSNAWGSTHPSNQGNQGGYTQSNATLGSYANQQQHSPFNLTPTSTPSFNPYSAPSTLPTQPSPYSSTPTTFNSQSTSTPYHGSSQHEQSHQSSGFNQPPKNNNLNSNNSDFPSYPAPSHDYSDTSSVRGILAPNPIGVPVHPDEDPVGERPSSAPLQPVESDLPSSYATVSGKRDPKAVFSATRKPLEVISTSKSFILRLRDSPSKILSIERKNSHPGAFIEHETQPTIQSKIAVYNAYGLLGIVVLTSETGETESYLMLITGVEVVGTIQEIPIYRITQTSLVTFHPRNEYFYSQMPKPPSMTMKSFIESGLFYFATDYHLTHSQQRLASMEGATLANEPMHKIADRRFFWNRFLARAFINKRLDAFVSIVIRGNIEIAEGQYLPESRQRCELVLISRLSCMRAGTRYNARGVNDNGDVGNFVETEQILITDTKLVSFLEIRGSVPVFWEEPLSKTGHTPSLSRTPEASAPAFKKHFEELLHLYDRVHIVNLLAKKKKEQVIAEAFEDQLTRWKGLDAQKIRYTYFDFHTECAKGYENIIRLVSNRIVGDDLFTNFGYFSLDLKSMQIQSLQNGIFRVNCLDCLDRTNVTQTALARAILSKQISQIDGSQGIVSDQTRLGVMLNEMWANNGDALSKAYTGTGAMKSSYTRKGKQTFAGMLDDGLKSVTRFYINTFKDSDNQVAVDLFLGKIEELVEEEAPLEDVWVKEKLHTRISEYTTLIGHNLFIGSYNCNAKSPPFSDGKFNIDEMLDPVKTSFDDIDIWVFGFQEIVELNAQQTLWSTDTTNPAAWEAAISARLNALRKNSKVVLLRSCQLVGIHICVFISEPQMPFCKELNVEIVKVGWRGVAGNKGAACLSFTYYDSTFCFVCAHLAAGQKEYDVRVSDYRTITSELKFGVSKLYGKSIADHEYAFWLGDFNWRIDLTYYEVVQKVYEQNWDYLLRFDQLKRAQKEGQAFVGFEEAPLKWAPTYKYDPGSDQYDTSELKRIPAWTDRVLWKAQEPQAIQCLMYTRCEIIWSDHRPIKGLFRLAVRTIDKPKLKTMKDELYKQVHALDSQIVETEVRTMRENRGYRAVTAAPSNYASSSSPNYDNSSSSSSSSSNPSSGLAPPLPDRRSISPTRQQPPPLPPHTSSSSSTSGTQVGTLIDVSDLNHGHGNASSNVSAPPPTAPKPGVTVQQLPNGALTPHYIKIVTICCDYLKCYNNVQLIMSTSNALASQIKTVLDYVDSRPDVASSAQFKVTLTQAVQSLAVKARATVADPTNQVLLRELAVQAKVVTEVLKEQLAAYI